ncbi:MAG: formimidoylglutamate deiminase [Deltaproteobacteria bacterium]|nr:formimidoylglutamate deiminase [Deltaproteobacteria bacterium]
MLRRDGDACYVPALTTAHSHAFQRAMRGSAQRTSGPSDDFWSWRGAMYALAGALTPESIHAIARVAYRELYGKGVRTVGEFHYVHHQADGTPYDDRLAMSDAVIEAARAEGLRIALLRVIYARAGHGRSPEGVQRRFADGSLDEALADTEALLRRYAGAADVRVGLAPHSVRAVPPPWLGELAAFAAHHALPLHMHVAEQPAEIEACLAETSRRPVELLAEAGMLSPRFVAVHATHLAAHEPALLGGAGAGVCLCPTTERDLGDGLPDVTALVEAGAVLSVGTDSHVVTAPLEDLRGVELGERLRTGKRVVVPFQGESPAEALWRIGSRNGARACGFDDDGGELRIDATAPSLELVPAELWLDAIVFGGDPSCLLAAR